MNDDFVQIHISDLSECRSAMSEACSKLENLLREHEADIPVYEKVDIAGVIQFLNSSISSIDGLIGR